MVSDTAAAADSAALVRLWREAWRPRERLPASQWIGRHVQLPEKYTADPGPYQLADYPFWAGVLELCDHPEVRVLCVMGGAQLGKTTMLLAKLLELSVQSPAPGMLTTPDRDSTYELRDRLYAFAEASRVAVPPEHQRNNRAAEIDAALWHLAWSGNTQRLSGKACKRVLCTEADRYTQLPREGLTQDLVARRTGAFRNSLVMYESTPQDETSFIDALYLLSDRRRWLCPCPRCGHHQELRYFVHRDGPHRGRGGLAGYVDAAGRYLSAEEARAAAYYLCEQGCRIDQADKLAMIRGGRWVPAGQSVDRQGRLLGQPEQSPRIAGVHVPALLSPKVSWGSAAADWIDSRTSPAKLQSFWNNAVGRKWTRRHKQQDWKRLGRRLAHPHRRGHVPPPAVFLTCGCDKQADRTHWVVRAWGLDGTSWLIDWGVQHQGRDQRGAPRPGSDLEALEAVLLQRTWPVAGGPNPLGESNLALRHLGIDSRFETKPVNAWVKQHAGDRVLPLMGYSGDRLRAALFSVGHTDRDPHTNKPLPGSRVRYDLNVDALKQVLAHKFEAALDAAGAWWLYETVLADGETYLRQLTNEERTVELHKKTLRPHTVWRVQDEELGNHYWDCEVYALFLAELVTGGDWPAFAQQVRQQAEARAHAAPSSRGDRRRGDGGPEQLSAR